MLLGTLAWCGLLVASAQADDSSGASGGSGIIPDSDTTKDDTTKDDTTKDDTTKGDTDTTGDTDPIIVPPASNDDDSTSVPEPTSVLALLALGGMAVGLRKSRKR